MVSDHAAFNFGTVMVMNNIHQYASRYNCYTGLVQIGPYESDSVEITFFSSKTVR